MSMEEEGAPPDIAMPVNNLGDALDHLKQPRLWSTREGQPLAPALHGIGGPLAVRVLRDTISLQLARRGYDGLRQCALWLITELTSDFLKAVGVQLRTEFGASAHVIVHRIQQHANIWQLPEWQRAQHTFARVYEPSATHAGIYRGPATTFEQKMVHPQLTAPVVAPLYVAMRGAWNYKASGAGRVAHTQAGQNPDDWPTASVAAAAGSGIAGRELSDSLRLSKKQRQHSEAWLQATITSSVTAPMLLPGNPNSTVGQTVTDDHFSMLRRCGRGRHGARPQTQEQ